MNPYYDENGIPKPVELVRKLRRTVGLFDGAMPITPKEAWEQAIHRVEQMRCALGHGSPVAEFWLVDPCREHGRCP